MQLPVTFSQHPLLQKPLGYLQAGRLIEALDACNEGLRAAPDHAELLLVMGVILFRSGHTLLAADYTQRAIDANPSNAAYYAVLASLKLAVKHYEAAAEAYKQARILDSKRAEYVHELLNIYFTCGKLGEFIALAEEGLAQFPGDATIGLHYKNGLPYYDRVSATDQVPRHREMASRFLTGPPVTRPHDPPRGEIPVIGYFAPYLHMNFMQAFLPEHGKDFRVVVYTNDLRIASCWQGAIRPLSADPMQNLQAIRADGIDILVDMVGPTPQMRAFYKILAHRPAPVQLSWFATTATSGTGTIDGVLADEVIVPEEETGRFSESILRLPQCYLPFAPHGYEPLPAPQPPAVKNGYITFGSANKVVKCSDTNFILWCDLLTALPGSRFHWQEEAFCDETTHTRWLARFEAAGIAPERLRFTGFVPHPAFYHFYDGIDIALDTTPYNGGITTFEAMWMGVPVVSLAGDSIIARTGASMLRHIPGVPQAAGSAGEYLETAKKLAADVPTLQRYRKELRGMVQASALMDAAGFTRALEDVYRQAWREYQEKRAEVKVSA